jgi:hypothetical protein
MNGLADQEDLQLRFDVVTKTTQPELHRYWTTRDRAGNCRLVRLVAEVLAAVEASVLPPRVGWQCTDCRCGAIGTRLGGSGSRPTGGTPGSWCGCSAPASSRPSKSPTKPRRACAISCGVGTPCAGT